MKKMQTLIAATLIVGLMATFAPPPSDMLAIYTALQGNQEAIERFIGLITEATSPADFFAPDNVQCLIARRTTWAH